MRLALRTLGMLALLQLALPLNLALTGLALLLGRQPRRETVQHPRTVLVSGGKMTKALQLARSFHRAGHRVVLVETRKYRFTGHRFSRAVDAFHVVPPPEDPGYADALLAIVKAEDVDVYVPVCSPLASVYDARARTLLDAHCEVVHAAPDVIDRLDDKFAFARTAASFGLGVPDTHRVTAPGEVGEIELREPPYVLKSIPYDPVNRLDLTPLPRPTPGETAAFAASKPISPDRPWIVQSFVAGREYCTHSTVRDGVVRLHCCCASSAFQLNYAPLDKPEIEDWVRRFVGPLKITGQVSFDFIEAPDGRLVAIECNPRTHSAITMFHDDPDVARAYLEDDGPTVRPRPGTRPTYWLYQELWRLLTQPSTVLTRLGIVLRGRDAIFSLADPLPFLAVHHLQIPLLLLGNLLRGRDWVRIDVNIGKLVEPGGD